MKSSLEVRIDGALVAPAEVDDWERRRARVVLAKLRRMLKVEAPTDGDPDDLPSQRDELRRLKEPAGRDRLRELLKGDTRVAGWLTKPAVWFSGSRRKQCVVEMKVAGCSAQQISQGIDDLMYVDTAGNQRDNLAACPDHYLLEPRGIVLEVIETTGGSPLPAQFFLRFGDPSGLKTPRDPSYPYESAGTARLADGMVIGGVRHQFRDEADGAHARLMCEFPALTPNSMIRQHQWHLACEWSHWLRDIQHRVGASVPPAVR